MFFRMFFGHFVFAIILFRFGETKDFRIVGGRNASTLEFPYQVDLEQWTSHFCGGSIIHKDFVLTAAHCVKDKENLKPIPPYYLRVRVGNDVTGFGGSIYEVEAIIVHEKYSPEVMMDQYDVALLKMKTSFKFSDRVQLIKMVTKDPTEGTLAWVTGFGKQEAMRSFNLISRHLMAVQLPIISVKHCQEVMPHVADDMLCAGRKKGHFDSCSGDSGGPLATKEGLAGIVAWGIGCGREGVPGVYTSVAHYRNWIDEKIKNNTA